MLTLAAGCSAASLATLAATFGGVEIAADLGWYLAMAACALATSGALGQMACATGNGSGRKFAGALAVHAAGSPMHLPWRGA